MGLRMGTSGASACDEQGKGKKGSGREEVEMVREPAEGRGRSQRSVLDTTDVTGWLGRG